MKKWGVSLLFYLSLDHLKITVNSTYKIIWGATFASVLGSLRWDQNRGMRRISCTDYRIIHWRWFIFDVNIYSCKCLSHSILPSFMIVMNLPLSLISELLQSSTCFDVNPTKLIRPLQYIHIFAELTISIKDRKWI